MPAGLNVTETPAILIATDAVGGVWHYSLALAAGFASAGWRVVLAVVGPPAGPEHLRAAHALACCTLVQTGLGLDWTATSRAALAEIAAGLSAIVDQHRVQHVHLHAPCLAAFAFNAPVVCVAHSCIATWWSAVRGGDLPADLAWHASATQNGLLRADEAIAPSAAFADQIACTYNIQRGIRVIHNGIAPITSPYVARQSTVLTAGRLWDAGKNIAMLDDAARLMHTPVLAAGPICGSNGERFAATGLRLLGDLSQPELHRAMSEAAIFASPSRYEPFGLAVLEAAQTGAALVLADISSFRELWDDAAIFLPPADVRAWAQQLDALSGDQAACRLLGAKAHQRAQRYTQSAKVAATLSVHAEIAQRSLQAA